MRLQVGLKDVPPAIALNSISFNLARSVGPALGGLLLSLGNAALAFGLNSISFVAMIVVLLRWRPETPGREKRPILPAIATGVRFCMGSSPIRRILLRGLALGFGISGLQALLPSIVRDRLGGGELDFGIMLGMFGIGSICAALALAANTDYHAIGVLIICTLYLTRADRKRQCLAGALLFLFELTAPLAFVLVWFYNGQRGACSPLQKKAFYWFYPVHLLVLAGITNLLL